VKNRIAIRPKALEACATGGIDLALEIRVVVPEEVGRSIHRVEAEFVHGA
jgi:hypothetical protein